MFFFFTIFCFCCWQHGCQQRSLQSAKLHFRNVAWSNCCVSPVSDFVLYVFSFFFWLLGQLGYAVAISPLYISKAWREKSKLLPLQQPAWPFGPICVREEQCACVMWFSCALAACYWHMTKCSFPYCPKVFCSDAQGFSHAYFFPPLCGARLQKTTLNIEPDGTQHHSARSVEWLTLWLTFIHLAMV